MRGIYFLSWINVNFYKNATAIADAFGAVVNPPYPGGVGISWMGSPVFNKFESWSFLAPAFNFSIDAYTTYTHWHAGGFTNGGIYIQEET